MASHFHVIYHTHWDRKWYHPFEKFRIRLIDMMDNLLAIFRRHPSYRFHMDAQTIIIEDYLAVPARIAISPDPTHAAAPYRLPA